MLRFAQHDSAVFSQLRSRGYAVVVTSSARASGRQARSPPSIIHATPGGARLLYRRYFPWPRSCELMHRGTNRFHAKAQSTQRPQSEERSSTLRFFVPLRLCVSCFDFFTPSAAMGHILPPLRGLLPVALLPNGVLWPAEWARGFEDESRGPA